LAALCCSAVAPAGAVANGGGGLSAELDQATGYPTSQLESKPACGAPAPGAVSCRAEILAVRGTGRNVSLRARPRASPSMFNAGAVRSASTGSATTGSATAGSAVTGSVIAGSAEPATEPLAATAPAPFTPAYLQWAYDLTWLSAGGGSGDTVAIVDAYDDPNAGADLAQFRQEYGLWPCATTASAAACQQAINAAGIFKQYNESGQHIYDPGDPAAPPTDATGRWEVEESLDVDAVSSLCPHCAIDLVEAGSQSPADFQAAVEVADALEQVAAAQAGVPSVPWQISMSWGEDVNEACDTGTWWFSGVSSLAAAGDAGYQGPSSTGGSCLGNPSSDTVSYPAAHSQVTAVGGTTLAEADNPRGFTESVWNDGYVASAGSYEATQSGCDTSQKPTPSYQAGVTGGYCSGRAYNDVSADADPDTGLAVYDSFGGNHGGVDGCHTTPADPGSCIVGGTSLSTPLTSAYEAIVGISSTDSPAWAYSDASRLNAVTSGSDATNATCLSAQVIICQAQTAGGWNGATGNGTISGQLAPGAPGIGGSYETATSSGSGTSSATVAGGIYPNQADTTYSWEFGSTTSYGSTVAGSGTLAGSTPGPVKVTATLTNLLPCTTYHFRLVASNSHASVYGYDNTLRSAPVAPANISPPTVTGTAAEGATLTGQAGTWTEATCDTPSYQWEESNSATGTFAAIPGATAPTYQPTSTDVGDYIELAVTESTTAGNATAYSTAIGPIATSGPIAPTSTGTTITGTQRSVTPTEPTVVANPTITSSNAVGTVITVNGGIYEHATRTLIQFFRCAQTCTQLRQSGVASYRLTTADAGHYIKIKLTIYGAARTTPLSSTNWFGPITGAGAGALSITTGAKIASTLKVSGSTGVTLATARVTDGADQKVKVAVSRATNAPTSAWLCVISGGAPVSCTAAHTVKTTVTLAVTVKRGQSLKLITVRT
jgi:hypothetical protein